MDETTFDYIHGVISSCGGFIKTNGYMVVNVDTLILLSYDECVLLVVKIKPMNIVYVAMIHEFMAAKEPGRIPNGFLGAQLKYNRIMELYNKYTMMEKFSKVIYEEPDMKNVPLFNDYVSSLNMNFIRVDLKDSKYVMVPVSKIILQMTNSDECGLTIYHDAVDTYAKYSLYKKKYKITANIYMRILMWDRL